MYQSLHCNSIGLTICSYYINAPGVSTDDACIWGDGSEPIGNWAPYVAGANTVANGDTYLKIGWNPIWTASSLSKTMPTFGIKIECSGSGCNGLPCSIDPSVVGIGGVTSSDQASGAGGASFCVVTVPSGLTADVVVFELGSSGSSASSSSKAASSSASPTPKPSTTLTHSSSSSISSTSSTTSLSTTSSSPVSSTSTSISMSISSSASASTSTSTSASASASASASSSSSSSSSLSSSLFSSSSSISSLISTEASSTSSLYSHTTSSTTTSTYPTDEAHVFLQAGNSTNGAASTFLAQTVSGTATASMSPIASATATTSATTSSKKKSAATATEISNSMFGLVLLLAIGCLI